METSHGVASPERGRHLRLWLGVILLGVGLLEHLLSARAIGGYFVAYRDHILGFLLLTAIAAVVIAALGWRFWRGRHDVTMLILGAVQAILGFAIWLNRFNLH